MQKQYNIMDNKLKSKLTLIENWLLQDDIKSFKIGKSENTAPLEHLLDPEQLFNLKYVQL